ncbi:CPBP family intramembrane metalloprotease [Bacillus sp. DNRA2]|uniref:CPBP family intramembrane glutamic endopeptidase n=1 Tax=Bacillus sp. DNRA2 TaxID=2723053 RepID=UPI00145FB8D1|nr:type II CAAX endopeptidase family protein [Bacillus sp. DNRA2]NMD70284.1 CPBP family intramembrane metalloprotease [Bacillus sp. DNRA2]
MKNRYTDLIKELSDRELLFHLFITQVILMVVAVILGFILFDNITDFFQLFNWSDLHVILVGGIAGLTVVLIDTILTKVIPEHMYFDGGLNERIFQNRSVIQIAIIAAVVSFSEEILFRGVIQTHFGLFLSSLIFAAIHYRYLFNWFLLLNIIILSFFIGFIFEATNNLVVTIFMHFLIDFLLGLMIRIKHYKLERTGRCS